MPNEKQILDSFARLGEAAKLCSRLRGERDRLTDELSANEGALFKAEKGLNEAKSDILRLAITAVDPSREFEPKGKKT